MSLYPKPYLASFCLSPYHASLFSLPYFYFSFFPYLASLYTNTLLLSLTLLLSTHTLPFSTHTHCLSPSLPCLSLHTHTLPFFLSLPCLFPHTHRPFIPQHAFLYTPLSLLALLTHIHSLHALPLYTHNFSLHACLDTHSPCHAFLHTHNPFISMPYPTSLHLSLPYLFFSYPFWHNTLPFSLGPSLLPHTPLASFFLYTTQCLTISPFTHTFTHLAFLTHCLSLHNIMPLSHTHKAQKHKIGKKRKKIMFVTTVFETWGCCMGLH
jgi:hypothetical protein